MFTGNAFTALPFTTLPIPVPQTPTVTTIGGFGRPYSNIPEKRKPLDIQKTIIPNDDDEIIEIINLLMATKNLWHH